jgi:hypothetical protein
VGKIPQEVTLEELEEYNWQVAEAIFEPLYGFVMKNGAPQQLIDLVTKATNEKHLTSFGNYVITKGGKLTPLAVYWITYAASHLNGSYLSKSGDWKDIVRNFSAKEVDLRILEMEL